MVLEDITGKALSVVDVFTLTIKALVDHLLSMLKKQGKLIHNDEVQWILTVPAIWTDTAKQFTRTSAEKVLHN
jgi:molecular chaperone DnaK (HSP70)